MRSPLRIATCVGCGCDDMHACRPEGCAWLRVDYQAGTGVCTSCPERVADFDRGFIDGTRPDQIKRAAPR
jgi:hypothetical protein